MDSIRWITVGAAVASALFATAAFAQADNPAALPRATGPAAQLSDGIDRVFKALEDPALKPAEKLSERRLIVRQIADEIFSFEETAKRALGSHWGPRTPEERTRFVQLFTDLLDRAYLRKVDQYDGEKVLVDGHTMNGDGQAVVQTTIVTRDNSRIPVEYLMLETASERWQVYDIRIAGMSLVASYRSQFNKIIQSASFDDLLKRLDAKVTSLQP